MGEILHVKFKRKFHANYLAYMLRTEISIRELTLFLKCPPRGQLHNLACEKWTLVNDSLRQKMARMASAAAWGLGT